MHRLMIQIPDGQYDSLRRLAFLERRSIADVAREAISQYLAARAEKEAEPMNVKALFSECEGWNEEYGVGGCVTYPVEITTEHSASSYGQPVVLVHGEPHGPSEMAAGELQVPPEYLGRVRAAGYAAQPMSAADAARRWEEAEGRPVRSHWHPEARLVVY